MIYIRQNVDRQTAVSIVRAVLASCDAALASGCLASVTEGQIRVRPLPIDRDGP